MEGNPKRNFWKNAEETPGAILYKSEEGIFKDIVVAILQWNTVEIL